MKINSRYIGALVIAPLLIFILLGGLPLKIFTIAFLIALIYWSCGFTLYVVFPPMPFLVGYYIMNHRIILGISWCIEAILIYVSFET